LFVLEESIGRDWRVKAGQIGKIDFRLELQQILLRLVNDKKEYGDVVNGIHKLQESQQNDRTQDVRGMASGKGWKWCEPFGKSR